MTTTAPGVVAATGDASMASRPPAARKAAARDRRPNERWLTTNLRGSS
jgi:hypothetical protein